MLNFPYFNSSVKSHQSHQTTNQQTNAQNLEMEMARQNAICCSIMQPISAQHAVTVSQIFQNELNRQVHILQQPINMQCNSQTLYALLCQNANHSQNIMAYCLSVATQYALTLLVNELHKNGVHIALITQAQQQFEIELKAQTEYAHDQLSQFLESMGRQKIEFELTHSNKSILYAYNSSATQHANTQQLYPNGMNIDGIPSAIMPVEQQRAQPHRITKADHCKVGLKKASI